MSPPLVGVLLTGGAGSRIGGAKQEARLGGAALWEHGAAVLSAAAPSCIQIGGAPIDELSWPHRVDLRDGAGPAGGVETALVFAERPVIVLAVDEPFAPPGLLEMAARLVVDEGASIAAPRWNDRWHPLCAAYGLQALAPLRERLDAGIYDLQGLLEAVAVPIEGDTLRRFGDPGETLMNVNTPEDLERAERILAARG